MEFTYLPEQPTEIFVHTRNRSLQNTTLFSQNTLHEFRILVCMRNNNSIFSPLQFSIPEAIANSKSIKASGCFNFKALWLQYWDGKVIPITSKLLSILLEIEVMDWDQGKQDFYAAA